MAKSNQKDKKSKDSKYLILAFIPIMNFLPFFHMYSKVNNKKWKILGWLGMFLYLITILVSFVAGEIENPYEYPSYEISAPEKIDYMNDEQLENYYNDSTFVYSTEFKLSDEYKAYSADYDEWEENYNAWKKLPETQLQYDQYNSFEQTKLALFIYVPLFGIPIVYLILLIIIISDRSRYLKALQKEDNYQNIKTRLQKDRVINFNAQEDFETESVNRQFKNHNNQIDINSASENVIASLNGLTVIDAKKAIQYREEHCGFQNTDEFFNCINAKPHIIARNTDLIYVGDHKTSPVQNRTANSSSARRIDI